MYILFFSRRSVLMTGSRLHLLRLTASLFTMKNSHSRSNLGIGFQKCYCMEYIFSPKIKATKWSNLNNVNLMHYNRQNNGIRIVFLGTSMKGFINKGGPLSEALVSEQLQTIFFFTSPEIGHEWNRMSKEWPSHCPSTTGRKNSCGHRQTIQPNAAAQSCRSSTVCCLYSFSLDIRSLPFFQKSRWKWCQSFYGVPLHGTAIKNLLTSQWSVNPATQQLRDHRGFWYTVLNWF